MVRSDNWIHAVGGWWFGRRAVCGAGRIRLHVPGRFDPLDRLACRGCAREFVVTRPPR